MSTRIVLLRAVNVGGATLPMAELRELIAELGAADPRTYIASGNAIADIDGEPAAFDRALEKAVEARFGFFREVISRTPAEVAAALSAHPFEVIEPKYSYLMFLAGKPTAASIEAARAVPTGDDVWEVVGTELHIRYAHGAGTPELNTDSVLRKLGVKGTARNLRTVAKLLELADR
jgi:uncharacterized protein (DUF1697 family)